jgi:NAD(P)-dependent dehydrogenase (short-subunit alcohol dehydrogenase family)
VGILWELIGRAVVDHHMQTPRRLEGKVGLVTGAGRGIGRAIAARLLDEGADVAIVELDPEAGEDARDELSARGSVHLIEADVSEEEPVARAIRKVAAWAGGLDVVVNNAAIANPKNAPIESLELADWRRVLDVNLTAPMLMAKYALAHLRDRRGSIVNIVSTRAMMSEPNSEAYAAAKGGLAALTHALAMSVGPDIRVNAVAPGWIATDAWAPRATRQKPNLRRKDHQQHPVGRVGTPEDVAGLVAYLASAEAGFVTGQTFVVDGGMTRKMIYT